MKAENQRLTKIRMKVRKLNHHELASGSEEKDVVLFWESDYYVLLWLISPHCSSQSWHVKWKCDLNFLRTSQYIFEL